MDPTASDVGIHSFPLPPPMIAGKVALSRIEQIPVRTDVLWRKFPIVIQREVSSPRQLGSITIISALRKY
jgi:hypothetical protein